jgi:streptogramin lyase
VEEVSIRVARKLHLFLAFFLGAAMAAGAFGCIPAQAQSASRLEQKAYGNPEPLLEPMAGAIGIFDGAAGQEDGHHVMYTTVKGSPAIFNVVDMDHNQLLRSFKLDGATTVWQHQVAPDGTVYILANEGLWSYSPVTKQTAALAPISAFPGESSLWSLTVDEQGQVYIGGYPSGKVFRYDPGTRHITDFGRAVGKQSQEYVRSIAFHDGYVYAGTGNSQIIRLNLSTGEKTDIAASLHEQGFCYDLDLVDNRYLFARFDGTKNARLYDLQTGNWLDVTLANVAGLHVTDSLDGKVYFIADGQLKAFTLNDQTVTDTGMKYGSGLRGADWTPIDGQDLPGENLVTVNFSGSIVLFNLQTHTVKSLSPVVKPAASLIQAVKTGPDGKIYVTGYQGSSGAAYDPATGSVVNFHMGQGDTIQRMGDKVYFGVYPEGGLYEYDPKQPPGDANPHLVSIIGEEQQRVLAMTTGDGKLFLGSVPEYGKLGGAVTVYNPNAPEGSQLTVRRNIVQDQSVVGLAYKDGLLFGSTNINGGLGATPSASVAKMFVYDVNKDEKVTEFTPDIPGLQNPTWIGELSVGPDGNIWGAAAGTLFALNPGTLKVIKSKVLFPGDTTYNPWSSVGLEWSKDGLLYAEMGERLIAVDPETLDFKQLADIGEFTIGDDGHLYYSDSHNITVLTRMKVADNPNGGGGGEEISLPVNNAGFEQDAGGQGIPGWSSLFATVPEAVYGLSDKQSSEGKRSLKISDHSTTVSVALASDPIPIQPSTEYTEKASLYFENGSASLLMRFFDEQDKQVGEDAVAHVDGAAANRWITVETSANSPAEAKYARLYALTTRYQTADVYFDDFKLLTHAPPSAAPGTFTLSAAPRVAKGGTFTATVSVYGAMDLYAVEALIRYDSSKLEVKSAKLADSFRPDQDATFKWKAGDGSLTLIASHSGAHSVSGDAALFTIVFKAKGETGNAAITLLKDSELADSHADETGKTYALGRDASVAVSIVNDLEDVNNDGTVNLADLTAVAKQVGAPVTDSNRQLDINGDQQIDGKDVRLIVQKILGAEGGDA